VKRVSVKVVTPTQKQLLKNIVLFVTVAFTVFEVLVAAGLVNIQNSPYLPSNLQTQEDWWLNPIWWVIGLTIIVNFAGYIENVVINNQPYDYNKFVETFFKYLPMLLIFTQFLPNDEAAVLAFALDYLKRSLATAGTKK
jgi:hypothetical protein